MCLQISGTVQKVGKQVVTVQRLLHYLAVVIVSWVPSDRRQSIRGKGKKSLYRSPASDIFDIWIQAPVFVDDDDSGKGTIAPWLHQIAPHLA